MHRPFPPLQTETHSMATVSIRLSYDTLEHEERPRVLPDLVTTLPFLGRQGLFRWDDLVGVFKGVLGGTRERGR